MLAATSLVLACGLGLFSQASYKNLYAAVLLIMSFAAAVTGLWLRPR